MINHPSGTVCGEQVSTWTGLLRDPQIVKSKILSPFVKEILESLMNHSIRIRWEDVEEGRHPFAQLIEASWYDEVRLVTRLYHFAGIVTVLTVLVCIGRIRCMVLGAEIKNKLAIQATWKCRARDCRKRYEPSGTRLPWKTWKWNSQRSHRSF